MADILLPAHLVVSGIGVPPVCTRHGATAVDRRKTVFVSGPPGWAYLLLLAGVLPFLVVAMVLRKSMNAAGWPFCARCSSRRRSLLLIGGLLLVLGFVVIFGSVPIARGRDPLWGLLVPLGSLLATVGLLLLPLSTSPAIARGRVTQDGNSLRLRQVAPAFIAALPAAIPPPPSQSWSVR